MNKFMKIAFEEGRTGMHKGDGGPFGAVIVKDGEIIAREHNQVLVSQDPTMHAEVAAIREATKKLGRFDLGDCEIYASCQPCPMCMGAIFWAKLKTLYYAGSADDAASIGFDDKFIYDAIKNDFQGLERIKIENIDQDGCVTLFAEWNDMPERRMY